LASYIAYAYVSDKSIQCFKDTGKIIVYEGRKALPDGQKKGCRVVPNGDTARSISEAVIHQVQPGEYTVVPIK